MSAEWLQVGSVEENIGVRSKFDAGGRRSRVAWGCGHGIRGVLCRFLSGHIEPFAKDNFNISFPDLLS